MNRIYRSIWNAKAGNFVAVSELAKSGGKKASAVCGEVAGTARTFKALAALLLMAFGASAYALPPPGVVAAGKAAISRDGGRMTIIQNTQRAVLNWQSFSIDRGESVQFVQPNRDAVALNRVLGTDPSRILGNLSANGQVFLVNPNGVLFGASARVNVRGLVASTLGISDSDFMAGNYHFAGKSDAGIVNQGHISAAGGYVALLGAQVSNKGVIVARLGTVALAAGKALTLDVAGDGLLNVAIDQGAVDALVDNAGMIQADGGQVLLSAQSAGNLLPTAVNNTGLIQAQTIDKHNGVIRLLGDMQGGTVKVGGTLDASAPAGGDGGFIDTSAARVTVADDTRVTTAAAQGLTGSWLIDPTDYTIAATGGDITGAALSANLANTNFTIQSSSGGAGTAGDVNVNDTVSWSANTLTLDAQNDININAAMNGSGSASLALVYGQGAVAAGNTSTVNVNAPVNLPAGENFSKKLGSDGTTVTYTVITSLGAAGSTTGTDLQGMNGDLAGHYALGGDIDAAATSGWNAGAGFSPVGSSGAKFNGDFDGLGHTIANLTVNRPGTDYVGMFGAMTASSRVSNVGLVDVSVTGRNRVGGLVGHSAYGSSSISNSYATGAVTGTNSVGGLVGYGYGAISNSYATATVSGTGNNVGGLMGYGGYGASISNSYATGTVTGDRYVGGLVGYGYGFDISNCYATGTVTGNRDTGGLVGGAITSISNSYWNTETSGQATSVGGGIGMTTAQMRRQANFTSATAANGNVNPAWDMAGIWVQYDTHTAPLLRSFMTKLTVTANAATKTYDGSAYSGGNGVTYSTTPNGDLLGTLSYGSTSQGARNAGSYALTATGLYSNQQGYIINYVAGALTVNKATLKLSGTRAYDGSSVVAGSVLSATGVAGETFAVTGAGDASNLASKNVQTGSSLASVTGLALGASGNGGLAGNYTGLSTTGSTVDITPAALTLSTGNVTKTYDGGLTAAGTAIVSSGILFSGDSLSGGSFAYTDKNAGAGNKTVTVSGVTVADGNGGGNYTVSYADNTTSTITPYVVNLTGSRVYDGTADVGAGALTLGTPVGSETLSLSGTGTVADKNVAAGKTVALGTLALGNGTNGGLASNYTFTGGTRTVDITPVALTLSTSNVTKTYDGGLTAAGTAMVKGGTLFGGDSLSGGSFAYTDKNAGTGDKTVTVSGVTIADGNGGGNYTVSYADNTTSTIDPAVLTASVAAVDKVYDGNARATIRLSLIGGLIGGETLGVAGSGSFNSKDAATADRVTVNSVALSDGSGLASNYSLATGQTAPARIMPKTLTLTGMTVADKTYDGNTTATLDGGTLVGLIGTETLSFGGYSGHFADQNVGTDKAVTVTGITLGDGTGLASNYSLANPTGLRADITRPDTVGGAGGDNKVTRLHDAIAGVVSTEGDGGASSSPSSVSSSSSSNQGWPSPPTATSASDMLSGLNLTIAGPGLSLPAGVGPAGATDKKEQ